MYIYDILPLNSSQNEKIFDKSLYRKSKHTFNVQYFLKIALFMR